MIGGPQPVAQAESLAVLIARSRRALYTAASRRLEEVGESMLVWQLLNRLRDDGALPQGELAFRVGQHPAGASRLLDQLERDGQVRRTRDRRDRRKLKVELTDKARRRLARTDPFVHAAAESVLAPLDEAERRTLQRLLEKLVGRERLRRRRRG